MIDFLAVKFLYFIAESSVVITYCGIQTSYTIDVFVLSW